MPKTLNATEARVHFGELLRTVNETSEAVTIEKNGEPVAVVLSHDAYVRLLEEPAGDWRELIRRSQKAFAPLRESGSMPDWTEIIDAGREERDRQLTENLLRR